MIIKETSAAVLHQKGEPYNIESIKLGRLNPDELLIENLATGICHTDFIAEDLVKLPAVFGHEAYARVLEVGSAVHNVRVNDRVIVSYPLCGLCSGCLTGKPYMCDHHMDLAFSGTRLDGTQTTDPRSQHITTSFFQQSSFSNHSIVQEKNVVSIESQLPGEWLAAIPCGIQTGAGSVLNTFKAGPQDSLIVFGTGAVGLSAIMAAKLAGLSLIIGVDTNLERLELAHELGAHYVFDANAGEVDKKIASVCKSGIRFALETSGNEHALNSAIAALGSGGTCGMVISPHFGNKYPFCPTNIFKGGKSLCGIIQGSAIPKVFLPQLVDWMEKELFPVHRLVQSYPFHDINTAAAETKSGNVVKAVLTFK